MLPALQNVNIFNTSPCLTHWLNMFLYLSLQSDVPFVFDIFLSICFSTEVQYQELQDPVSPDSRDSKYMVSDSAAFHIFHLRYAVAVTRVWLGLFLSMSRQGAAGCGSDWAAK